MPLQNLPYTAYEDPEIIPEGVENFLANRGWMMQAASDRKFFQNNTRSSGLYFTWVEAMAYETYLFMNIGRD